MELLNGAVIVITGASSGFGKGAAMSFAQQGAVVVLAARREYLLDEVCAALSPKGLAVPCDVSKQEDVEKLYRTTIETFGHFDVWINNAGGAAIGKFTEIPLQDHIQVIETDLMGTLYGSYYAMTHFRAQGAGILINVASMIGKVPAPYYASYAAAKHGVVGLSASLRQELQEQKLENIKVCTVLPMAMDTPFFEHAANYTGREAVPLPPLSDAQEVIDVLVDLVKNPKDETPVGKGSVVATFSHNVAPSLTEGMMAKSTHKSQMEDAKPAPIDSGSLTQPDSKGTGIKGNFDR